MTTSCARRTLARVLLGMSLALGATGQAAAAGNAPKIETKAPSREAAERVLCLGDSLTEGLGVAKEAAWPALVEAELKRDGHPNVLLINGGVSGSTTASGLSRLKWHLKGPDKPRVVILALGANDGLRGLDLKPARQNLADVIRLAKSQGIAVLLAGMQIPPNYGQTYTDDFRKMFTELAAAETVPLLPFLLEGVGGEKELNQADGIHPNEAGHKIIAATVAKHLKPLLAEPAKP